MIICIIIIIVVDNNPWTGGPGIAVLGWWLSDSSTLKALGIFRIILACSIAVFFLQFFPFCRGSIQQCFAGIYVNVSNNNTRRVDRRSGGNFTYNQRVYGSICGYILCWISLIRHIGNRSVNNAATPRLPLFLLSFKGSDTTLFCCVAASVVLLAGQGKDSSNSLAGKTASSAIRRLILIGKGLAWLECLVFSDELHSACFQRRKESLTLWQQEFVAGKALSLWQQNTSSSLKVKRTGGWIWKS